GGDPLVEDESGSTPWRHFLRSSMPGETGTGNSVAWPSVGDASFVATELKDPRVMQLFSLARRADALYLEQDSEWKTKPRSQYECHDVVRATTQERLYRATEAYVRTAECSIFQAPTNT